MIPNQEDLLAALDLARPLISQLTALLKPHLPLLTDETRSTFPRPPQEFLSAAPVLVQGMVARPQLAAVVGFDGRAVAGRLQATEAINQTLSDLVELEQLLSDGRLVQLAEAWRPSLAAYGVSKELEHLDPTLRQVIEPIASVFKARRTAETVVGPVQPVA